MTFQVGHAASRQRWGNGLDRIVVLKDFGPIKSRDLRPDVRQNGTADVSTRLTDDGIHAIVLQTTYAQSELPAVRFNDYAKDAGLTPILAARARSGMSGKAGRERYSRRAKALVQVGTPTPATSQLATRAVGMKLEIVTDRNPYSSLPGRRLPLHVLYKGQRLQGAMVMLTNLDFDAKPLATAVTNANGQVTFSVPPVGEWLINVIWSEPIKGDPKAEFDTTFSSLTFGYNPRSGSR